MPMIASVESTPRDSPGDAAGATTVWWTVVPSASTSATSRSQPGVQWYGTVTVADCAGASVRTGSPALAISKDQ